MVYVCCTCGAQFEGFSAPSCCPICEDERQYVGNNGQQEWILQEDLLKDHENVIKEEEHSVTGIGTQPSFAIGQRALLLQTGRGNILWDCINVLTAETKRRVQEMGGIQAIAISHPHFYTGMADWAAAFDAPVYIHELDKQWVTQPSDKIQHWTGDKLELLGSATIIRLGGHFPGSCVLHWSEGFDGAGILCTGDTIQAIPDKGWVSFMYSYPNLIPLPAEQVERIRDTIKLWQFQRLYGGWFGKAVSSDAHQAVIRSADRYIGILDGSLQRRYF